MAQNMGLGTIGGPNIGLKRKFRWTFEVTGATFGNIPRDFVKLAARPNLNIEETEINFLNGKTWIPGKGTWDSITVTYYDVIGSRNIALWSWLATVYDFTAAQGGGNGTGNAPDLKQATLRSDYAGTATLNLFDGCGNSVETWTLRDAWPQAINFGDLDYASSEEVTIELTMRYSQVSYQPCAGSIQAQCNSAC